MAEKKNMAELLADAINKQFKTEENDFNTAFTLDEIWSPEEMGFVPTGNLALDFVIGKPGFPAGRVVEVAGPYGSAKSTVIACAIAAAQKAGIHCVLQDTEFSYSGKWAKLHGIDPEKLNLLQPIHLQDVFDKIVFILDKIAQENNGAMPEKPTFIAVDSLSIGAAEEMEEEDSTSGKQRGLHAKIIALGLRKIIGRAYRTRTSIVFISQLKDNPGMLHGANQSKLGGHAIEFQGGILLEIKRRTYLKDTNSPKPYGMTVAIKAIKNKFVEPFRERTFDIIFKEGIRPKEIFVDFLEDPLKELTKSGGWFDYKGSKYRKSDLAEKLSEEEIKDIYDKLGLLEEG